MKNVRGEVVRTGLRALGVAVLYLVVARLSLVFVSEAEHVFAFWPPAGLLLGALLLSRTRDWAWMLVAVAVVNVAAARWAGGAVATPTGSILASCAEALAAATLVRMLVPGRLAMSSVREATLLVFGAAVVANGVVSVAGAAASSATGTAMPLAAPWPMWLVSCGLAMTTVTPLVLSWADTDLRSLLRVPRRRMYEGFALATLAVALSVVAFALSPRSSTVMPVHLVVPILLWAAIRFGPRGVSLAASAVAALSAGLVVSGGSVVAGTSLAHSVLELQLFLGVITVSCLLLAAAVAERGRKALSLDASNRTLRALVEVAPLAVLATDVDDRVIMWNPAAERMFGWTAAELIGRPNPVIPPSGRAEYERLVGEILAGRQLMGMELVRARKDGSLVEVSVSTSRLVGSDGETLGRMAIIADVSERKRAAEQQALLYTAIDQSSEGVVIIDFGGRTVYASSGFERITGIRREQAVGRHPRELVGERTTLPGTETIAEALRSARAWSGTVEYAHPDGNPRTLELGLSTVFDASGQPTKVIGVVHDATREVALEAQLRQSQKMEAIGQLAGGVAHDFNNILTAIVGFASLLEPQLESPRARSDLEQIMAAAQRAAKLTQGLLAYSRRQTLRPELVDVGELLRRFESLARPLIGEDVELELAPPPEPLTVRADVVQLEQVLMNLASNARHAMPRGGRLSIACARRHLTAEEASSRDLPAEGGYACLSVADTGEGMDPETQQHIFEPFFTTKPVGEGTGLGLAIVYGIMRQHLGAVEVESAPGRGALFRLYLPLHPGAPGEPARARASEELRGSEVILVAEDDADIRTLIARVLGERGYRVLTASDGEKALALFRESPERVALLLLDVVMPRMSGPDVLAEARRARPDVPALFMSGYAAELLAGLAPGDVELISKPVSVTELVRKVRQMLDAATART